MLRRQHLKLFLIGGLALASFTLNAQTNSGLIAGSVSDPSGAAVVGVKVTVTSDETQSVRTATSDSNGVYTVTNLAIGHYTATVIAPGFKKEEQQNLNVVPDGHLTVDFHLQVGDVNQSVEVIAAASDQIRRASCRERV